MPSVSLPCPDCSTPLIVDEDNAGQEVLCPACQAQLRLPTGISSQSHILRLNSAAWPPADNNFAPSGAAPSRAPGAPAPQSSASSGNQDFQEAAEGRAVLPQTRDKSGDEELRRLAGAASAPGAAHSFTPEESLLPAGHQRTRLPTRRALQDPAPPGSPEAAAGAAAHRSSSLPARRKSTDPDEPVGGAGTTPATGARARAIEPIEVKPDIEISATPLRGPSQFAGGHPASTGTVRPAAAAAASRFTPVTGAAAGAAADPASGDHAEEAGGTAAAKPLARGGYRLGNSRDPHFTPAAAVSTETEASTWGTPEASPQETARNRRLGTIAVLLVVLAAGGTGFYILRQAFQPPAAVDPTGTAGGASPVNVMKNVEDARRVIQRFLAADSPEKLAQDVRHPEITLPRIRSHHGTAPIKPRKVRNESQSWNELRLGDKEFIRGTVELDDFKIYRITLELMPDGSDPKVDWESFANWAEIPWKDFLKTPPPEAVDQRVTLSFSDTDQYYNYYSRGREEDLLCFKLEDPERYGFCWAYCQKDTETASQLLFHLKRARQRGLVNSEGKLAMSCVLQLRFPPEGMKSNQVVIEKFISDDWVLP